MADFNRSCSTAAAPVKVAAISSCMNKLTIVWSAECSPLINTAPAKNKTQSCYEQIENTHICTYICFENILKLYILNYLWYTYNQINSYLGDSGLHIKFTLRRSKIFSTITNIAVMPRRRYGIYSPQFYADLVTYPCHRINRWLSGKLWYLQDSSVGDTIVYH